MGETEKDYGPVDHCPGERVVHGWTTPDHRAKPECVALVGGKSKCERASASQRRDRQWAANTVSTGKALCFTIIVGIPGLYGGPLPAL